MPPLSLLVLLTVASTLVSAALALLGIPLLVSTVGSVIFAAAMIAAWRICGRENLRLRDLPNVVAYVIRKTGLYLTAVFRKPTLRSTRSERRADL